MCPDFHLINSVLFSRRKNFIIILFDYISGYILYVVPFYLNVTTYAHI